MYVSNFEHVWILLISSLRWRMLFWSPTRVMTRWRSDSLLGKFNKWSFPILGKDTVCRFCSPSNHYCNFPFSIFTFSFLKEVLSILVYNSGPCDHLTEVIVQGYIFLLFYFVAKSWRRIYSLIHAVLHKYYKKCPSIYRRYSSE